MDYYPGLYEWNNQGSKRSKMERINIRRVKPFHDIVEEKVQFDNKTHYLVRNLLLSQKLTLIEGESLPYTQTFTPCQQAFYFPL